ncbi:hypothetical protein P9112_005105 [Eukaryota sp. TZLM1-RC]
MNTLIDIDFTSPEHALCTNAPHKILRLSHSIPKPPLIDRLDSASKRRNQRIGIFVTRLKTMNALVEGKRLQTRRERLRSLVEATRLIRERHKAAEERRHYKLELITHRCHEYNHKVSATVLLTRSFLLQKRLQLSQRILRKQVLAGKRRETIIAKIVQRCRYQNTVKLIEALERRHMVQRLAALASDTSS